MAQGSAMAYAKYLVAFIVLTVILILLFRPSVKPQTKMSDREYLSRAVWSPSYHAFNRTNAPKKILVTGGSGFVGSHLVDRLMMEGHTVVVLDNFYTSTPANVQHWQGHPRFTLVEHDVINPYYDTGFHQIYHLASPASPPQYQKDPVYTTKTNVWGTLNMLELAHANNNARFLLASTSEVYGDPLVHPQVESDWGHVNPIGPRACYDEAKRMAETLTFDYHRTKGSDIRVVRIFNTYGPRMDPQDGRVVSNFIVQALNGNALTVYGQGKQTRSFGYVSDLVDGLVRLMNTEDVTGPINIGNPTENTVYELAKIVTEILGGELKVSNKPLPTNDPQRRKPDITLAQTLLGWSPKIPLSQGLQETIKYFKKTEGIEKK